MKRIDNTNKEDAKYWCLHCGEPDSAIASYIEEVHGFAVVESIDGDFGDFESNDNYGGYPEITGYVCSECNKEEDNLRDLITKDRDDVLHILYKEKEKCPTKRRKK